MGCIFTLTPMKLSYLYGINLRKYVPVFPCIGTPGYESLRIALYVLQLHSLLCVLNVRTVHVHGR